VNCEEPPPALLLGPAKILPPASERRKNHLKNTHIYSLHFKLYAVEWLAIYFPTVKKQLIKVKRTYKNNNLLVRNKKPQNVKIK
jgi:hypothetical protein